MLSILMMVGLLGNQTPKEKETLDLISGSIKANFSRVENFYAKTQIKYTNFTIEKDSTKEIQLDNDATLRIKEFKTFESENELNHSGQDFDHKYYSAKGSLSYRLTKNKNTFWEFIPFDPEGLTPKNHTVYIRSQTQMPKMTPADLRTIGVLEPWMDYPAFIKSGKIKTIEEHKSENGTKTIVVSFDYSSFYVAYFFDSSKNYLPIKVVHFDKNGSVTRIESIEYKMVAENCWFPVLAVRKEKIKPSPSIQIFESDSTGFKYENRITVKEFKKLNQKDIDKTLFNPKFPKGTEVRDSIIDEIYLQE